MKQDNTTILANMESDLSAAKGTHAQIWSKVMEWQDLYDGSPNRSLGAKSGITTGKTIYNEMYTQKDIQRVVEGSLPDIVSPFVSNDDIIDVQAKNALSAPTAEALTVLLNKQFAKGVDVVEFIETLGRDVQIEGTVFTKVGWGVDDAPMVENIQFSELLLDPSARRMKDLKFAIQRSKVTVSEIKQNTQWYGKHDESTYSSLTTAGSNEYDDYRNQGYGRDDSYSPDDRSRQLIEVFEYYGVYDLKGDGSLVPVLGIWSGNTLLRLTESPYPESWNGIPFEAAVYTRRPYNIYGDGLPEMLKESQKMRQNISTAIIENMKNATVGQRFVQKGAMDAINFRRMLSGERIIYMNKAPSESFVEGTFNDIPQSVFAVSDVLKAEQESLSGMSDMSSGLDPRALNSNVSATAVSITNSNAQKRMLQITRHISEMLERIFKKWIDLNQMMLENGTVRDDAEGLDIQLTGAMLQGSFDVGVTAGTAGIKQSKIQNLQMMMSQSGNLPPQLQLDMMAQLSKLLDMPELEQSIKQVSEDMSQPNPAEQQAKGMAMQLEMQEKQASIAKDSAKAKLDNAKAMETFVETERASYGL